MNYTTKFGSLHDYDKGQVVLIEDNPKNYVFSNVFEVANQSVPYERVAVAKNFEYVIEIAKADGKSSWFTCAHDEFVLCMDGEVEVHLVKLNNPTAYIESASHGAHLIEGEPDGRKMGRLILRRGHQGLLPRGAAYQFQASSLACLMLQTIEGPVTIQKWSEICQTS